MKNYFKKENCVLSESDLIERLGTAVEQDFRFADYIVIGWLFNFAKSLQLDLWNLKKKVESGASPSQPGVDYSKQIEEISTRLQGFEEFPKLVTAKLDEIFDEVKQQKSGLNYLAKELDLLEKKLEQLEKPPVVPAEPAPALPEDPTKPKIKSSRISKK